MLHYNDHHMDVLITSVHLDTEFNDYKIDLLRHAKEYTSQRLHTSLVCLGACTYRTFNTLVRLIDFDMCNESIILLEYDRKDIDFMRDYATHVDFNIGKEKLF